MSFMRIKSCVLPDASHVYSYSMRPKKVKFRFLYLFQSPEKRTISKLKKFNRKNYSLHITLTKKLNNRNRHEKRKKSKRAPSKGYKTNRAVRAVRAVHVHGACRHRPYRHGARSDRARRRGRRLHRQGLPTDVESGQRRLKTAVPL